MGNSISENERKGYRILKVEQNSPASEANLRVLMDYIIQPQPQNISLNQENVQLQVYSLTDQNIRSVNVHLARKHIGVTVRQEKLSECILKVTNVLKGSPLQNRVKVNEDFIVGMIQQPYSSLKGFVLSIRKQLQNESASVSLGVYSAKEGFRIVKVEVKQLLLWKQKGRGILGCELAEGWIHRLPPSMPASSTTSNSLKQSTGSNTSLQSNSTRKSVAVLKEIEQQTTQQEFECEDEKSNPTADTPHQMLPQFQQIEKKMYEYCPELKLQQQKRYRGKRLRSQALQDASSFCKCVPVNKLCGYCSYEKEGVRYFFCEKTKSVFGIPQNMLFTVSNPENAVRIKSTNQNNPNKNGSLSPRFSHSPRTSQTSAPISVSAQETTANNLSV